MPKDVQRILSSHKSIMNRKCSTRRLFLKSLQHPQENTFLIKMQAFRPSALLNRDSNTELFCEHWEIFKNTYVFRGSRPEVFRKKGVVWIFTKFKGRHLRQSLFFDNFKKETLAQVFPVNFAKFLRTPFFTEHLRWLPLEVHLRMAASESFT